MIEEKKERKCEKELFCLSPPIMRLVDFLPALSKWRKRGYKKNSQLSHFSFLTHDDTESHIPFKGLHKIMIL
jgi:hypothetical protein